jgi:hypothetical protein
MDTPAGLGFRNPLNPVNTGFKLEPRKTPLPDTVAMISL